jgi:hypothetical protein
MYADAAKETDRGADAKAEGNAAKGATKVGIIE